MDCGLVVQQNQHLLFLLAETLESYTSAREIIDFDSFSDRIDEESGTEDGSDDEEAHEII